MPDAPGISPQLQEKLRAIEAKLSTEDRQALKQLVAQLPDLLQRFSATALEAARRIGQAGWTLPMSLMPNETSWLVQQAEAEGTDLDSVFVRFYDDGGFENLKHDLLQNTNLRHWRPLVEDALAVYEAGHTLVVVPALLTVVEGAIAELAGASDTWKAIKTRQLAMRLRQGTADGSILRAVWTSVEAFVNIVFAEHRFDQPRPRRLNRHWILHGRDVGNWNRADCLRLFQAIDTILLN